MKTSWQNVNGQFSIEIYVHDSAVWDIDNKELTVLLPQRLFFCEDDTAELIIDFISTGYNDTGSIYGGPDNLGYPPEGDDERLLESACLLLNGVELILTKKQQETLFGLYELAIDDVELDCDS